MSAPKTICPFCKQPSHPGRRCGATAAKAEVDNSMDRAGIFKAIWDVFPKRPGSSQMDAWHVFEKIEEANLGAIQRHVESYAKWFREEAARNGKGFEETLRFAPYLSNWLKGEKWPHAQTDETLSGFRRHAENAFGKLDGTAVTANSVDELAGPNAWARRIGGAWQKSIDAIFETGRLLIEAKAALPHGEFGTMIGRDLPFGADAAQRLMKIAADPKLTNAEHVRHLPSNWGTLYELSRLDTQTFEKRIQEGTIRPDMQRRDVATGGARSIMASREQSKESLDYFPTPPWATRALMNDVLPHLGVDPRGLGVVAEPACGEGHMSGVLLEYCSDVRATDIADYSRDGRYPPGWVGQADFLESDSEADWIITNPPFGDVTQAFVLAALERSRRGVAVFVRQQWLEGQERYETLFRDRPPTLYAQFAERVPLVAGRWDFMGSTATAYCWLVWQRDVAPQPVFWIPPRRRLAYLQPDDIERFTAHPVMPGKRPLAPFKSGELADQIITDGYAVEVVDFDAISARLAVECGLEASKLQIRRRANQLNLGSRDRQRQAVTQSNIARAGAQ